MTRATPTVEIVIPVHDEERRPRMERPPAPRLLEREFPLSFRITIADNASRDRTWQIASRLRSELDSVEALRLDRKGRGRALRAAWLRSHAEVVAYMDVDLSTGLEAFLPLVSGQVRQATTSLASLLAKDASSCTWVAATSSSMSAAPIELSTGKAVLVIGGFNGQDRAITLARFEVLVAAGKIDYNVAGGGFVGPGGFGGPGAGGGAANEIDARVASTFTATTVDGTTVYDLSTNLAGS